MSNKINTHFMYDYTFCHKINVPCFHFSKITDYVLVVLSHKLCLIDGNAELITFLKS